MLVQCRIIIVITISYYSIPLDLFMHAFNPIILFASVCKYCICHFDLKATRLLCYYSEVAQWFWFGLAVVPLCIFSFLIRTPYWSKTQTSGKAFVCSCSSCWVWSLHAALWFRKWWLGCHRAVLWWCCPCDTMLCSMSDWPGGVALDSPLEIHTQPFLSQHLHTECISIRNILSSSCVSKMVPCHV